MAKRHEPSKKKLNQLEESTLVHLAVPRLRDGWASGILHRISFSFSLEIALSMRLGILQTFRSALTAQRGAEVGHVCLMWTELETCEDEAQCSLR